jgi:hypothetical protein
MQFDTEDTEASRRLTERCIGVNAIAVFAHQVNPNSPRPEAKVSLGELLFVLSGLCDEIGLGNLGSKEKSGFRSAKRCLRSRSRKIPAIQMKFPEEEMVFIGKSARLLARWRRRN